MANLQIIGASWGLLRVTSTVIDQVNRQTTPQSLFITASNSIFGDGWPGVRKTLFVAYRYGDTGKVGVSIAQEGNTLHIQGPPASGQEISETTTQSQLSVLAAAYGPRDTTTTVQNMINQGAQSLSLTANNQTFTDTWPGVRKSFVIVAAYTGQVPFIDIVPEGSTYSLKYRPPLRILSASWGLEDATNQVQNLIIRRTMSITASNSQLGFDGWPGHAKSLVVVHQYGDQQPQLTITTEGNILSFDYEEKPEYRPAPDASALNVIAAAYGQAAVTSKVLDQLKGGKLLNFTANNALFGDSWPGTAKSFVLSYSWGPASPKTFVVAENGVVQINQPPPNISSELVPQTGLFAAGDVIAIQSGPGQFLAVSQTGQILANAASIGDSTNFTVHLVPNQTDQFTLSHGTANVTVGQDGTLYAGPSGTAASFVASLTTAGTSVLSVVGAAKVLAAVRDDNAIVAAGNDAPTFDTTFGIMLNATQEGLNNHIAALGIDLDTALEGQGDAELLKLAWDLTGGMFLAIGLGPLISGSLQIQTGAFALIRSNAATNTALNGLISAVKANLGSTIKIGLLLGFAVTVWDAGLWWKIIRLALNFGKWYAIGWVATKILQVILLPEVQAAQLVVSFAIWAYTTTIDAIAYINAVGAQVKLEDHKEGVVPRLIDDARLLDIKPSLQNATTLMNGLNIHESPSVLRNAVANGVPDNEDDEEEDLVDQLHAIEIRRKLRNLRKRRLVASH